MKVLNVKHCTAIAHIKCSINTWVNDWGIASSEGWGTWPELPHKDCFFHYDNGLADNIFFVWMFSM